MASRRRTSAALPFAWASCHWIISRATVHLINFWKIMEAIVRSVMQTLKKCVIFTFTPALWACTLITDILVVPKKTTKKVMRNGGNFFSRNSELITQLSNTCSSPYYWEIVIFFPVKLNFNFKTSWHSWITLNDKQWQKRPLYLC